MERLEALPLSEQKSKIRSVLISVGTDMSMNDNDPFGNGDQSFITSYAKRDAARELFSIGGDINTDVTEGVCTEFGTMCLMGSYKVVQSKLNELFQKIPQPYSQQKELKELLEARDTSLRLTPLLLLVSVGKFVSAQGWMDPVTVATELLKAGASPDCKDVLGKTVVHYGAGAMATENSMHIVDMCIKAAKSSNFFGKEIELHGLKNEEMNGCRGVAGGYNPSSDRRAVYLPSIMKEVWIKPLNMRLLKSSDKNEGKVFLTDVQDRLGSVSLHEVVMQDRLDVAEFLLRNHNTSIHTTDLDGVSPIGMAMKGGLMRNSVCNIISDVTRMKAKKKRDAEKQEYNRQCANCQKSLSKSGGKQCSKCKITSYCDRDCQLSHWKAGHKKECKDLISRNAGIKLDLSKQEIFASTFSLATLQVNKKGSYSIPDGVNPDEKFVIKVQGCGDKSPIMVYDESRTCDFFISPGTPGFQEVLDEIRKEQAWMGKKTFMKASFDKVGNCTVYPSTAGVKAKYSW